MALLESAAQDLRRLRRIVGLLAKYGYGELLEKKRAEMPPEVDPDELVGQAGVAPSADAPKRFRLLLEELGPTFIKLGQVLSARPDLVAESYVEELKLLQSECEPLAFEHIEDALRLGLARDPADLFAHIDPEPLATASIAQVHRARTKDGRDVVLKVQRPGIDAEIRADLDILYRFAQLLNAAIEESALTDSVGVVREFEVAILAELDFLTEAANVREFRRTHQGRDDIVIPLVIDEFTCATVLCLEYLDGVPLTHLPDEGIDRKALARAVLQEAFDEVFIDGLFHCDPHPGNVLLLTDGRYGILDLGVIGRLTPKMRDTLVVLCLAVALKDADTAARTLYRLGHGDDRVSISNLRDDLNDLFARYLNRRIEDVDSTRVAQEIFGLVTKHKIRMPAEYTMLARAATTIEGLVRELDPDLDIAREATPYAEKLLFDRVGPDHLQGGLFRAMLQLQGLSEDLPLQLSQILSDLASGNTHVNIRGAGVDRLATTIVSASAVIAGSVVLAAFIVGTFIALASVDWRIIGVPIAAIVGVIGAVTISFWVSAYAVLWPRVRKISIARMFRR